MGKERDGGRERGSKGGREGAREAARNSTPYQSGQCTAHTALIADGEGCRSEKCTEKGLSEEGVMCRDPRVEDKVGR